ncbi:MAG TPA: aspartate kinase [Chitinophagaceae bacterium]|nr:aspartate kinase [Chitinophagaceae bacterium]
MLVMKFGGTSVGSAATIKQVKEIVKNAMKNNSRVFLVVSAMSGTTDMLIDCGKRASSGDESFREILKTIEERHLETVKELLPVQNQSHVLSFTKTYCNELEEIMNGIFMLGELSARTLDRIMSYGELMSSRIISASFVVDGLNCVWKDSREIIKTNDNFGNASVDFQTTYRNVGRFLSEDHTLFVLPGFIASANDHITTTLGRGGSDYTAAIIAGGVESDSLEIWTDVSGMMTADPRWVANARPIPMISYKEAM